MAEKMGPGEEAVWQFLLGAVALGVSVAVGRLAQRVGMPLISGYLLAGILLGPDVLGLVSRPAVLTLHPLESACLAVIAVAAGSEMRVGDLKRYGRNILVLAFALMAAIWAAVFATCVLFASQLLGPDNVTFLARALRDVDPVAGDPGQLAGVPDADPATPQPQPAVASDAVLYPVAAEGAGASPTPFPGVTAVPSTLPVVAWASLCATIMGARSPAAAIAVVKDEGAAGPFTSTMLAVIVLKDVLVFLAFSINVSLVRAADGSVAGLGSRLAVPFGGVGMAALLGTAGGVSLDYALRFLERRWPVPGELGEAQGPGRGTGADGYDVLPSSPGPAITASGVERRGVSAPTPRARGRQERADGPAGAVHLGYLFGVEAPWLAPQPGPRAGALAARAVVVVAISLSVWHVASLCCEPLLACVVAGTTAVNGTREVARGGRRAMHHGLSALMPGVNVAFFTLAGATLELRALRGGTVLASLLIFGARLLAIVATAVASPVLTTLPPHHGRLSWRAQITQAGVALGLVRTASAQLPWGTALSSSLVPAVLVNLLIGPPLFRSALAAAGETRATRLPTTASAPVDGDRVVQLGAGARTPQATAHRSMPSDVSEGPIGAGPEYRGL